MSKLQLFRDFVNERLAAAALEICGQYEKTLAECQDEICRCREKSEQLQRLGLQPEIKLHTDVQEHSLSEPPQIKEEQDLWTSQWGEQLQWLQSDATDPIFTPRVKTYCDPEDPSQLTPLDQTHVENREGHSLHINTIEVQIKEESDEEDYGLPEPTGDSQTLSVTPDCPTAQSLEKEERGGLLPGLKPIKSMRTQVKCSRPIPSPWTMPMSSFHCTDSEDGSACQAESKTAEKPYHFVESDKSFSPKSTLVKHRIIHTAEKRYQCEECDKAFSRQDRLVQHIKIHTGQKPYPCEECDKAFPAKAHLVKHRRIHTGEKPYQCQECDKAFTLQSNLVKHRRLHTGEKPYQCQECDKAFSEKGSLVKHGRIHTGEKPYQCQECDKVFSIQSNLVKHRRLHTGEKPYQCQECEKAFYEKANLVKHRRVHTGEKPYQCEECDKAFSHRVSLVNHRKIHTRLDTSFSMTASTSKEDRAVS